MRTRSSLVEIVFAVFIGAFVYGLTVRLVQTPVCECVRGSTSLAASEQQSRHKFERV